MSSSVVPAVCYDACNSAYIQAQQSGKTAALCASGSAFSQEYGACQSCVAVNNLDPKNLDPKFQEFLDFCTATPPQSRTDVSVSLWTVTTTLIELNGSPTLWTYTTSSTITRDNNARNTTTISSQNSTSVITSTTVTDSTTATSSTISPTDSAELTQSGGDPPRSNAWIAGPIVGSILGLGFVLLIWAICVTRSKSHKRHLGAELEGEGWNTGDKPQLHSDDIKLPPPSELDALGMMARQYYEMPAGEPAAAELNDGYDPYKMPANTSDVAQATQDRGGALVESKAP
ncbi:hypothetical protein GQ53DRAFT_884363 [Thozetella sp. PMI_491]|nr:hypothetical protein GQ53DRAFT_884363 [Thozetella sp. PMI_491]